MPAIILNGKEFARLRQDQLKARIGQFRQVTKRSPALALILIGTNHASEIYVKNKRIACDQIGIHSINQRLPESISQQALIDLIEQYNQDETIDGILVQLPLPRHIDSTAIIEAIVPAKDVDSFHPYNVGRLMQRIPHLRPCTPYGVTLLLRHYKIPLLGKHVVIVGASNIVGRPMALEMLLAGSTVTVCHRFTRNLEQFVQQAEILIVAIGKPNVVKTEWIDHKAIVVDVGINYNDTGNLVGDIDFTTAYQKVAMLTPVPGGVGPMTVSALLENTITAAFSRL